MGIFKTKNMVTKEEFIIQLKIHEGYEVASYTEYVEDMKEHFPDCEIAEEQIIFYDPISEMYEPIEDEILDIEKDLESILKNLIDTNTFDDYRFEHTNFNGIHKLKKYEDNILVFFYKSESLLELVYKYLVWENI